MEKVKKPKLVNPRRFVLEKRHMEKPTTLKSQTVPDQTMSLKEIVKKFVMKQSVNTSVYEGVYHLDKYSEDFSAIDLEKFGALDITERTEIMKEQARKVADMKRMLHEKENLAKKQKHEEDELNLRMKKSFLAQQAKESAAGADDSAASVAKGGKE